MKRTHRFNRLLEQMGRWVPSKASRLYRRLTPAALQNRRGTVIIIVLALLGMLTFIGFFVFGITQEANQAATYFSGAAKVTSTDTVDADAFFNFALRQIIV